MTKDEIILKSKQMHTIEYDYSLIGDVKNTNSKITVICKQHGAFYPRLYRFLKGSNCPFCVGKTKKNTNDFINEYKDKYGVYDLTKFNYIDSHTKSVVICEKHGEFEITPTNLLSGCGCPKCKTDKLKGYFSSNMEDFTYKANKIHNNKYIYTSEYVNNHTPIEIRCKCCGNTFLQTPNNHLQGKGCPFCNKSHLENNVINFFNENNICFEYQKRFEWLGKQSLDFFVPQYNIAIECQGKQHFEQTMFGNLNKIISLDEKKNVLCDENGIKLFYLTNSFVDVKPSFYCDGNTLNNINELYTLFNINPVFNDVIKLLKENNIIFSVLNNIIVINNFHIHIILNNHIFLDKNECNRISIENEKKGIKTMWLKQYEWDNKKHILSSFILSECGVIYNRIYARNCYIKELTNSDVKDFLNKNSMYGYRSSSVILGLLDKNTEELVMVYTFGNAFYGKGKYDIEVLRVATKINTQVIGGASKLWKYFLKNFETIKINNKEIKWETCVYYVDFDHNNGKSLKHLDFDFQYYTDGGYHNFNVLTNKVSSRNPNKNKVIKELIKNGIINVIPTSGTKVYVYDKRTKLKT